jgi:hypothetical protein
MPGERDLRRGRRAGGADELHQADVELSQQAGWKSITKRKPAPEDADDWKDKTDKLKELVR